MFNTSKVALDHLLRSLLSVVNQKSRLMQEISLNYVISRLDQQDWFEDKTITLILQSSVELLLIQEDFTSYD